MAYGKENVYFGKKIPGFINATWIELIGFDNTSSDMGVGTYLDTLGFKPDIVSLLLSSINTASNHQGMEKEYCLPPYVCSYMGHPSNDDRERQDWTNWQLRKLVEELRRQGVKTYCSFFASDCANEQVKFSEVGGTWDAPSMKPDQEGKYFTDLHPEVGLVGADGRLKKCLNMTKYFNDGISYVEFVVPRMVKLAKDYGFAGFQLADNIPFSPGPLSEDDYSDQVVGKFLKISGVSLPAGIKAKCETPEEFKKRSAWIYNTHRLEWFRFQRGEWTQALTQLIGGLNKQGIEVCFNSAWTRDPLEALYRYAADYKAFAAAGAKNLMVENCSTGCSILADAEMGYHLGYDYRKFLHYEYAANLMCNKARTPELPMTCMTNLRDTLEQYDVFHHMPMLMQRLQGSDLNNYVVTDRGLVPVCNGPWFCLSDGFKKHEWLDIRLCWDNGYTPALKSVAGFTVLWSDDRMEAEIVNLIKNRGWGTTHYLAKLLSKGAPVHKIAPMQYFDCVTGPLLVPNPGLMNDDELKKVYAYDKGPVAFIGVMPEHFPFPGTYVTSDCPWQTVSFFVMDNRFVQNKKFESKTFYDHTLRPEHAESLPDRIDGPALWTHPLLLHPVCEGLFDEAAKIILEICDYPYLTGDEDACNITQIHIDDYTDRFLVDNDEYVYVLPVLHVKRDIESVNFLTKPKGYGDLKDTFRGQTVIARNSVSFRIPPRGMDILEVKYSQ